MRAYPFALVLTLLLAPRARATEAEPWFENPGRTRYLYSPSALLPHHGEGSVSQRAILSAVEVGILDHVSLFAGSGLLYTLLESRSFNLVTEVKAGASFLDRLHLAVGVDAYSSGNSSGLASFFGVVTYGTGNANLTLTLRRAFLPEQGLASGGYCVVLAGQLRVARRVALVAENWTFLAAWPPSEDLFYSGLAVRFLGEHWSAEIGVIRAPELFDRYSGPLPWAALAAYWR